MGKTELTNMVMIQDKASKKVLVQDRVKKWKGISFPGGHVEEGESIVDSAIREIKEETGLTIYNLKSCGIIHWYNVATGDRYLEFLFKTTDFDGELVGETEEGRILWTDISQIEKMNLSQNFADYLPMFLSGGYSEAFYTHGGDYQSLVAYK